MGGWIFWNYWLHCGKRIHWEFVRQLRQMSHKKNNDCRSFLFWTNVHLSIQKLFLDLFTSSFVKVPFTMKTNCRQAISVSSPSFIFCFRLQSGLKFRDIEKIVFVAEFRFFNIAFFGNSNFFCLLDPCVLSFASPPAAARISLFLIGKLVVLHLVEGSEKIG